MIMYNGKFMLRKKHRSVLFLVKKSNIMCLNMDFIN